MNIPLMNLKDGYPDYIDSVKKGLNDIIENCSFIGASIIDKFEENWANYLNLPYAVGCSNGTDALIVALKILNIGPGDKVIVPVNTFIATAEAVANVGANIVFVDVEENTGLIDLNEVEKALKKEKIKAVIPVHLYGQMADVKTLKKLSEQYNFKIIEDAAQAQGSLLEGKAPGAFGDVATFSFYPGKNLGAWGDAGSIVMKDEALYLLAKKLINHGRDKNQKYLHDEIGFNNRLDSFQALVLNEKLKHLNNWNSKRRNLAEKYTVEFGKLKDITVPFVVEGNTSVWYVYTIYHNKRNELQEYLKKNGISTGIYYPVPLHQQPAFNFLDYKTGAFPVAEKLSKIILSLPLWPEMTEEQLQYVVDKIRDYK